MSIQVDQECIQYLTPDGFLRPEGQAMWNSLTIDEKKRFYHWMTMIRLFDRRAVVLQRQGRIGTYAPLEGQEAAQVGSALALSQEDWIFPSYREHGVAMIAGMPISQIFLYWMGRVEGCLAPEGVRLLPPYVPIATQLPHAVGAAWASQLRDESSVSVAYFGDGATSEGDFHEACNFAGVFKVPVIFFCQNNGYAISVPFSRQSASKTIAERAQAYGFPGVRVDGNDVLAVYDVMKKAVERARSGKGPTLIEAITYRKGSHTTADDATRYRPADEVEQWITQRDPIDRFTQLLRKEKLMNQSEEKKWEEECKQQIDIDFKKAESKPPARADHLFTHVFEQLSPSEQKQQLELQRGEQQ